MVILHLISTLKKCCENRNSVLFRSTTVCKCILHLLFASERAPQSLGKEIENYVAILRFFVLSFQQVSKKAVFNHRCRNSHYF